MFTGLQGQKMLYTTSFVEKVCKKIMVSIRAILLECWADSMTLHLSFPSMYQKGIQVLFKNKAMDLAHQSSLISSCQSFSSSYSLFQASSHLEYRDPLCLLICLGF